MKRLLIVLCLCLLVPVTGIAEQGLLSSVSERLSVNERVSGDFTQARDISFLRTPLVSSGTFSIDHQAGLLWQVETPVRSQMQVHDERVLLDGVEVADPGVGQFIGMILQAFVTRDLSLVAQRFEVSGDIGATVWRLDLKPRQWLFRKAIDRVELTGDLFLLSVTAYEPDGSATRITFQNVAGHSDAVKVENGIEP